MTCMPSEELFMAGFKPLIQFLSHKQRLAVLKEITKYIKVTLVRFDKYGC